jgi:hypothetical protein
MKKRWRWPFAGFVLGALAGATVLTVNVVGASSPDRVAVRAGGFGEILHTPALLARAGKPVELSYDVVCGALKDEPQSHCSPSGSVFVRPAGASGFARLPLREDDGLLSAVVPAADAEAGFDYYAVMGNGRGGTATLPEAGAVAPQHVWALDDWTTVDVGAAQFGRTRAPSSVVRGFSWGRGDAAIGLDSGREQSRIGPSAFDVAPDGSVVLLDQVNHRLAVARRGGRTAHVPIAFSGGEGDLAVGGDGTVYVLDSAARPVVRAFTAVGASIAATPLAEATADMIRVGPSGPLVHSYPSEMWLPTGAGRPPLSPGRQLAAAQPFRAAEGGLGVVVRASPSEVKLALVRGDRVVHAWLLHGESTFGEVQLAEPYGDGMLVVVRLWNEHHAEFRVLRLGADGVLQSFDVAPAEWAESGSLSRFRLHGSTLYQQRSDPSGIEIATFEIGGTT